MLLIEERVGIKANIFPLISLWTTTLLIDNTVPTRKTDSQLTDSKNSCDVITPILGKQKIMLPTSATCIIFITVTHEESIQRVIIPIIITITFISPFSSLLGNSKLYKYFFKASPLTSSISKTFIIMNHAIGIVHNTIGIPIHIHWANDTYKPVCFFKTYNANKLIELPIGVTTPPTILEIETPIIKAFEISLYFSFGNIIISSSTSAINIAHVETLDIIADINAEQIINPKISKLIFFPNSLNRNKSNLFWIETCISELAIPNEAITKKITWLEKPLNASEKLFATPNIGIRTIQIMHVRKTGNISDIRSSRNNTSNPKVLATELSSIDTSLIISKLTNNNTVIIFIILFILFNYSFKPHLLF